MIQLQNPLLRFHKTTKGNFSGEDFQISPTVSFLDDSDSLAQIMPYKSDQLLYSIANVFTVALFQTAVRPGQRRNLAPLVTVPSDPTSPSRRTPARRPTQRGKSSKQ